MNILEIAILRTLLTKEEISIYALNKTLNESGIKTSYATVLRTILKMQKENLVNVNEKKDAKETKLLFLTNKGTAALAIEGDLSREELVKIGLEVWRSMLKKSKLPPIEKTLTEKFLAEVFADSLNDLKPKVNLKFFNENWFKEASATTSAEAFRKNEKKYRDLFESKGIWETEEEREKRIDDTIRLLEEDLEEDFVSD